MSDLEWKPFKISNGLPLPSPSFLCVSQFDILKPPASSLPLKYHTQQVISAVSKAAEGGNTVVQQEYGGKCHGVCQVCYMKGKGCYGSQDQFSSVLFSPVAQSCLTLCDPMDCSTSCFSVHHQLLELSQTQVHWVGNAIQPSHPLLSPSPPIFNLAQHQGLFKWGSSSHQVANVLEFQLQHQSFQWIFGTDFL